MPGSLAFRGEVNVNRPTISNRHLREDIGGNPYQGNETTDGDDEVQADNENVPLRNLHGVGWQGKSDGAPRVWQAVGFFFRTEALPPGAAGQGLPVVAVVLPPGTVGLGAVSSTA